MELTKGYIVYYVFDEASQLYSPFYMTKQEAQFDYDNDFRS